MLYLKTLAEIDELLTASLDSALVVERAAGEANPPLAIRPLAAGGIALTVCIECR